MATKKVTKESKHEPTKSFDWQLYAEELEKECERLKRECAIAQDEANTLADKASSAIQAYQHLSIALYYISREVYA